jgi:hypothetical protein
MQAHAAHARAALALEHREIVHVDAVADAQHALARAGAGSDAARYRGCIEQGDQRLFVRERVGLGRIGSGSQAASLEQPDDPPRYLACHAADLGVVGGRERVEPQRPARPRRVDTVEHERVEVDVQVERIAEALHEGDGGG